MTMYIDRITFELLVQIVQRCKTIKVVYVDRYSPRTRAVASERVQIAKILNQKVIEHVDGECNMQGF